MQMSWIRTWQYILIRVPHLFQHSGAPHCSSSSITKGNTSSASIMQFLRSTRKRQPSGDDEYTQITSGGNHLSLLAISYGSGFRLPTIAFVLDVQCTVNKGTSVCIIVIPTIFILFWKGAGECVGGDFRPLFGWKEYACDQPSETEVGTLLERKRRRRTELGYFLRQHRKQGVGKMKVYYHRKLPRWNRRGGCVSGCRDYGLPWNLGQSHWSQIQKKGCWCLWREWRGWRVVSIYR